MAKNSIVKITDNFSDNLASIDIYWQERGVPARFDRLLDDLDNVVDNLERFPEIGKSFSGWHANTLEAMTRLERLQVRLSALHPAAQVRQYTIEDYLILYAVIAGIVYLLAIRHHQQLSFDFGRLWLNI